MSHFSQLLRRLLLISMLLGTSSALLAQDDPCNIPPGIYRTYTIGGWGANCNGANPGCVRDAYFSVAFPSGLTIGGTHTIHFTSSAAVNAYLPAGGAPDVLHSSYLDPTSTPAGVFAAQLTGVALAIGFGDAGVPGFANLRPLVAPYGIHNLYAPFAGWTVEQIFNLANQVLGGDVGALPAGISLSDLNTMLDRINRNFDNGTSSLGWLVLPGCDLILPVEITSFTAVAEEHRIVLHWRTGAESDIAYYEISRRDDRNSWTSIARINSFGNSAAGFDYSYADEAVVRETPYTYCLTIHSLDGSSHAFPLQASASLTTGVIPSEYQLMQNYPNPFNPSTTIAFSLPDASIVRLKVFDVAGRIVAELANREYEAGNHTVGFDAGFLTAGVYFYQLEAGSFSAVRKLTLIK